jgi:two-component system phosphate regulon sensor histidine kinase PhoR
VRGSRIQRRILYSFLAVLLAALVPATILVEKRVGDELRAQVRESLEREALVLAADFERASPAEPDVPAWAAGWEARARARVSVIATDGRVLGDTSVAPSELASLENQALRPEVRDALEGRIGSAARGSTTVGRELMYVAVPVGQPVRAVVRVALPLESASRAVGAGQGAVWLAGLVALAMALAVSLYLARHIARPALAMARATRAMSQGDFDAALPSAGDDELGDLARALGTLKTQLAARIAELRAETEKLRTILNGMTEGVALVQHGTITVANPAFATLIGARDVEGRRPLEAARLPELAEAIAQAGEARKPAERELSVGARTLHVHALPLGEPSSKQAVVMLVDMTEPRRLERLRRDLVANASHELRTPVAAIVGVAETLAAGASEDAEARKSFVDILLRHSTRLSRLTNDLLDLSRLEAGYKPRVEAIAAHASVATVVTALGPRAEARRITLETAVPRELSASADRAALEQILTNLVDNAIKYTPEGGRVRITADARDGKIQLAVEDNGPGIPAVHLPRLFERFYRVDDARSRELGGTGLGLAIVKHLVLANGGEISVESQVGRGSRFVVSLPRA